MTAKLSHILASFSVPDCSRLFGDVGPAIAYAVSPSFPHMDVISNEMVDEES